MVGFKPLVVVDDGKTLHMNGKGTVRFSMVSTEVTIKTEKGERTYKSARGVIEAPHGAKVLPYFKRDDAWYVVMVEQFRIALPGKTVEPAGGEVDEANPRLSMARELEEEAHVTVSPEDVEFVFSAYIQPSMMRAKAFGGIVEIKESQLPTELIGGEHQFGEYTVVSIQPLLPLLRSRDDGSWTSDLETYILLDAVAKAVGLIEKRF
ncbi:MAG: hypothetical protein WC787_02795 [Patescibacteria group bacterium]|jgi:8-oxo-dGTP pyrophosphatase MutT (NUDIX family)